MNITQISWMQCNASRCLIMYIHVHVIYNLILLSRSSMCSLANSIMICDMPPRPPTAGLVYTAPALMFLNLPGKFQNIMAGMLGILSSLISKCLSDNLPFIKYSHGARTEINSILLSFTLRKDRALSAHCIQQKLFIHSGKPLGINISLIVTDIWRAKLHVIKSKRDK